MGCRCGAPLARTVHADRRVAVCTQCSFLEWQDIPDGKAFALKHHLRCLQEEIREAEKEADEKVLMVHVEGAEAAEGDSARLRVQIVEGDPRWLVVGSTADAEPEVPAKGIAKDGEAVVAKKHKGAMLLDVDRRSWARLEGRLKLTPRSSARIQRTLLQAYLLAVRLDPRVADLDDPRRLPRIPRHLPEAFTDGLRPAQARAVRAALALPEDGLLLVQGPPGTGKTTVIATLVRNAVRQGWSILVASHTHIAVDNALRRLLAQNPLTKVVRFGETQAVAPDLHAHTARLADFVDPPDEPDSRPLWDSVTSRRPVVGMTLDALAAALVKHRDMPFVPFDLVIVDEAGMNLLPKLALARAAGRRLVLVGDHQQLPPIVTAPSFRNDASYRRSPFERLQAARGDLLILLDEQFRSHPDLYAWSAATMYQGRVASGRTPGPRPPTLLGHPLSSPLVWLDTSALPGSDVRLDGSRVHPGQAVASARVVAELVREHGFGLDQVGLITPFRKQAELYTDTVRRLGWKDADVLASTVDAFQGDERPAIVVDLTSRAPAKPHEDPRRLNVSLTRAQDLLVLLGPRPYVADPHINPWLWSLERDPHLQTIPFDAPLPEPPLRAPLRR